MMAKPKEKASTRKPGAARSQGSKRGRARGVVAQNRRAGAGDAPNRSEFIRKNLLENAELTPAALNVLWKQNGFRGSISTVLFYQVRSRMNNRGPSKRRGRKPGRPAGTARPANIDAGERAEQFLAVEEMLDGLIGFTSKLGDPQLVDLLLRARRRASSALIR